MELALRLDRPRPEGRRLLLYLRAGFLAAVEAELRVLNRAVPTLLSFK